MAAHPPGDSYGDGVMICARPNNPDLLAVPLGLPADDLHVTLLYLGKAGEIDPEIRERLEDAVLLALKGNGPIEIPAGTATIEHLGGPDVREAGYVAVTAKFDEPAFRALHDAVVEACATVDVVSPSEYVGDRFTAHMTLTYLPTEEAERDWPEGDIWSPAAVFAVGGIVFGSDERTTLLASEATKELTVTTRFAAEDVDADEAAPMNPTSAMATEARRAVGWIDNGKADAAAHMVALARRIGDREPLTDLDVEEIISTYTANRAGLTEEGALSGEPGFPNRWRVLCSLVGGSDGHEWALRKRRQLERAATNAPDTLATKDDQMDPTDTDTATIVTPLVATAARPAMRLVTDEIRNELRTLTAAGALGQQMDDEDIAAIEWEAVLLVENVETGDGRWMDMGAITWEFPPLSLYGQFIQAPGHDGAPLVGSIMAVLRDGAVIVGYGKFDSGEWGKEAKRMLAEGTWRGVSVDLDSVRYEMRLRDGARSADDEMDFFDMLMGGDDMFNAFTRGRIRAATLCGIPAFAEAWVRLVDPEEINNSPAAALLPGSGMRAGGGREPIRPRVAAGETVTAAAEVFDTTVHAARSRRAEAVAFTPYQIEGGALVASATSNVGRAHLSERGGTAAMLHPDVRERLFHPPDEFFVNDAEGPCPWTVDTDTGRVFGHIGLWGSRHVGAGVDVPRPTVHGFSALYGIHPDFGDTPVVGSHVITASGNRIPVAPLAINAFHPRKKMLASDAFVHYADSGCVVAVFQAHETPWGIYVAGALHPEATDGQIYTAMSTKLSGDWRPMSSGLELIGVLGGVTVTGFNTGVQASAGNVDEDALLEPTGAGRFVVLASAAGEIDAIFGGSDVDAEIDAIEQDRLAVIESRLSALEDERRSDRLSAIEDRLGITRADALATKVAKREAIKATFAVAEEPVVDRKAALAAVFAS